MSDLPQVIRASADDRRGLDPSSGQTASIFPTIPIHPDRAALGVIGKPCPNRGSQIKSTVALT
jgi:hypothetical protein